MEFEDVSMAKIKNMSQDEAKEAISFLETEKLRHKGDIAMIDRRIKAVVELKLSGEDWHE